MTCAIPAEETAAFASPSKRSRERSLPAFQLCLAAARHRPQLHTASKPQFAYYAKWGMSAAQALQTAYLPAAHMLNYGWENQIGSIEKGKFADIIAVSGNPLTDVTEMERVKF